MLGCVDDCGVLGGRGAIEGEARACDSIKGTFILELIGCLIKGPNIPTAVL